MAAIRYTWMFRIAAVAFLALGASFLWRFGFTDYQPHYRPIGLVIGLAALAIGALLFRYLRFAIGASAVISGLLCLCATVAAPNAKGPVILFFAAFAIVCGAYAVLAARVLFEKNL